MSRKGNLVKNTFIIFIGKACTQFLSLLFLPLYTTVLNSSEYGIADLVTTYITLLVPLITLQLETATFRYLIDNRNDTKKTSEIISTSFILSTFCSISLIIIGAIVSIFVKIPYFTYIVFLLLSTVLSNYSLQVCRGLGDNVNYSIGCFVTGLCSLSFNLLFLLVLKTGLVGLFIAQIIANFVCFLYLLLRKALWKKIKISFYDKTCAKEMLGYSLPLIPNGVIWWIINASDRTIINIFMNTSANGIYAVSNKFSTIIIQIYNVFNLSWTESASMHIADNDRDEFFSDMLNDVIALFSSLSILCIAAMPIIFPFMIGKEFAEAYIYIPYLIIGVIFNIIVSFVGGIYIALKETKKIAATSFWAGIINILSNLVMVKKFGIYAAALSTIFAFFIMSVFRIIDIKKTIHLKLSMKNIVAIVLVLAVCIFLYYQEKTVFKILNLVFATAFCLYLNYDKLKIVTKRILHSRP